MSQEPQAIFYGKVELIPGVICDGYVLDNGTAVMSERGTADLLGMTHTALQNVATTGVPKSLKPFIDKDFIVATTLVKVVAENSHHKGRNIIVYDSHFIESILRAYVMAVGHNAVQKNQMHIGRRCVLLFCSLAKTALEAAIREACGLSTEIQATVRKHLIDPVPLLLEDGFKCSVEGDIATLKDITDFFGLPLGTIRSAFRKHRDKIQAIPLNREQIAQTGSSAAHMVGYRLIDVTKMFFKMNTVRGIKIKEKLFGEIDGFARPDTSVEVCWQAILSQIFKGFGFHHNFGIGQYRVDFLVEDLRLVLECNGYEHRYYNEQREREREQLITQQYGLIRFHQKVSPEVLFNAILQIQPQEIIRLEYSSNRLT